MSFLRVLQVTGTLDPEYGGPPVVMNQLTRSLMGLGYSIDVATLDDPMALWLASVPGNVISFGPPKGKYGYSRRLRHWLEANVNRYDVVVVHGIWRYESHVVSRVCSRLSVPYLVFVHGALDPWFKARYPVKHVKKLIYWRLSQHKSLQKASGVIFTEQKEMELASQSFTPFTMNKVILPLGIDQPEGEAAQQRSAFYSAFPELRGKRILLFMSRLHPKKGCDLLIEAFARVVDQDDRLHLVLAGPDEVGLRPELEAMSERLRVRDRITWTGMLTGDPKWGAYLAAEVFVLISHSENFGIVIAEALACGVPVLTTDKVNIWRDIASSGAGLIGTNSVDSAEELLISWLEKTVEEREDLRRSAHLCYRDYFSAENSAKEFVQILRSAARKSL